MLDKLANLNLLCWSWKYSKTWYVVPSRCFNTVSRHVGTLQQMTPFCTHDSYMRWSILTLKLYSTFLQMFNLMHLIYTSWLRWWKIDRYEKMKMVEYYYWLSLIYKLFVKIPTWLITVRRNRQVFSIVVIVII